MAEREYQGSDTQESEIDPRLQEVPVTSQPYSNTPALGSTTSQFRPLPPSPFPQQHQQHPQLHHQQQYGPPQSWQQDGFSYYAPPGQHPQGIPHVPQHSGHPFQPYQDPSGVQMQPALQPTQPEINDSKRTRACEACRNLKVKCEPNSEGGRCKRCAKAGRNCVTSAPSRKRQKKTDSRVADLEKRIDDLQRQMKSAKEGNVSGSDDGNDGEGERSQMDLVGNKPVQQSPYNPNPHGDTWKRRFAEFEQDGYSRVVPPDVHVSQNQHPLTNAPFVTPEARMGPLSGFEVPNQEDSGADTITYGDVDVVGRGLLQATIADELFMRYTKLMAPHMPIVVFPDGTSSEVVRKSTPILFLAILSVASGEDYQDLQITLNKEIIHTLAERIIVSGEKSLELIQALQVVTIWFWREGNGASRYYQFVHLAATMAIDLRLNKKAEAKRQPIFDLQQPTTFTSDTESLECRRAWLGCYLMTSSIAMGMRRPTLVRHSDNSKYFEDCITRLRHSENTLGNDHKLCDLVRLQTFADDLAVQILPNDSIVLSEAKVRTAHKGFEKQMKDFQEQTGGDEGPLSISFAYNVINLYMYELAMEHVSSPEPSKTPRARGKINQSFTQQGSSTAFASTLGILDTFSKFSVQEVRTLPILHFAQIAHTTVSLVKMYYVAKADSECHKDVPVTATIVEERLGSLLTSLCLSAADGKSLAARTYLKVIGALQTVFEEHKHTTIESIKARFSGIPSMKDTQIIDLEEPQAAPQKQTASHPTGEISANKLHLLSAAAMEQSNTNGSESEIRQMIEPTPEDSGMAAIGQLIGEADMGFISDEGFLGVMQTMFLQGLR